jgi:hypothetical protein
VSIGAAVELVLARHREVVPVAEVVALRREERRVLTEHAELRRQPHDLVAELAHFGFANGSTAREPSAPRIRTLLAQLVDEERDLPARPQARHERVARRRRSHRQHELVLLPARQRVAGEHEAKVVVAAVLPEHDELVAGEQVGQPRGQHLARACARLPSLSTVDSCGSAEHGMVEPCERCARP